MIIVGKVNTTEEAKEIILVAKISAIGQRAQFLGRQA